MKESVHQHTLRHTMSLLHFCTKNKEYHVTVMWKNRLRIQAGAREADIGSYIYVVAGTVCKSRVRDAT